MNNKDLEEYLEHREEFEKEINKIIEDPDALSHLSSLSMKLKYSFLKKVQIFLQKTDKYKTDDLYNRIAKGTELIIKANDIYGKNNNTILNYLTMDLFRKVMYSKSKVTLPKNPLLIDEPIIDNSYNYTDEYDGVIIGDKVRLIKNSFNNALIGSIFHGYYTEDLEDNRLIIENSFNKSSLKSFQVTDKIKEIKNSINNCDSLEEFVFGINKETLPPKITYINDSLNGNSKLNNIEIYDAFTNIKSDNSFFKVNLSSNKNQEIEEYILLIINNQYRKKYKVKFDHENKTIYCYRFMNLFDVIMAINNIFSDNECEYIQLMPYLKGKLYDDYNIVYGQDNNNTNQNGFQNRKKR